MPKRYPLETSEYYRYLYVLDSWQQRSLLIERVSRLHGAQKTSCSGQELKVADDLDTVITA